MRPARVRAEAGPALARAGIAAAGVIVLAAVAPAAPAAPARRAPPARVASYVEDTRDSLGVRHVHWRVLDPASGRDTLLVALADVPTGVRWDRAFTRVEFAADGAIFRMPWALGSVPVAVAALPPVPGVQDWWWNPDAHAWQAAVVLDVSSRVDPGDPPARCVYQLWQFAADGTGWAVARTDTTPDMPLGGCAWPWGGDPACRRAAAVELSALEEGMEPATWDEAPALRGTAGRFAIETSLARARLVDTRTGAEIRRFPNPEAGVVWVGRPAGLPARRPRRPRCRRRGRRRG